MSENSIYTFADFVQNTSYDTLPEEAAAFLKRHILDSFGCAIAGVSSDKGKWGFDFARSYHAGPAQATVLGHGDRLSAMGAAFANAELMNGLDFEAAGLHLPPFVMPGVLADAELNHRGGKDFLTAYALGLEIGVRMAHGLVPLRAEGEHMAKIGGPSSAVFGGAAAVAKTEGFDREQTADALGLVAVMSTVNSQSCMHRDLPINSGKYLMAGWAAQTGLSASLLVKCGHRGDKLALDSELGYWMYSGHAAWNPERAFAGLGEDWRFMTITPYKVFPTCGMMSGGLEALTMLIEEAGLRPEEIEGIHTYLDPSSAEPMFHNAAIHNQIDMQFSVPYNFAVCACGYKPGAAWQSMGTLADPRVRSLMGKVVMDVHPECAEAQRQDMRNRVIAVEVTARGGQVFRKELRFVKGTVTTGAKMSVSDEEYIAKFRANAEVLLPGWKIDRAVEALLNLEQAEDMSDVTALLHV